MKRSAKVLLLRGMNVLYKYIGDHNPSEVLKNLKRFVEDGTISASDPRGFNDPSEFKINFSLKGSPSQIEQYFKEINAIPDMYEEWMESHRIVCNEMAVETRDLCLKQFGVVCLTPFEKNGLMWSHYSVSHKGFCIGFDDEFAETIDDFHLFSDVKYVSHVPEYNVLNDMSELIDILFFSKHESWGYEKEKRIITKSSGVKKFDKSFIKEIILGHNVSQDVESYAKTLIGSHINIFKMRTPEDSYSLQKEPLL